MPVFTFKYKMTCEGCASAARKRIESNFGDLGLTSVTEVATESVKVTVPDDAELSKEDILSALREGDPNASIVE